MKKEEIFSLIKENISNLNPENLKILKEIYFKLKEDEEKQEKYNSYFNDFKCVKDAITSIPKNKKVCNERGQVVYSYASFDDIVNTVLPVLSKHNFIYRFESETYDDKVVVSFVLEHKTGIQQKASFSIPLEQDNVRMSKAQLIGSALTYAKRYVMSLVLGLVTEDDTDNNIRPDYYIMDKAKSEKQEQVREGVTVIPATQAQIEAIKKIMASHFSHLYEDNPLGVINAMFGKNFKDFKDIDKDTASKIIDGLQQNIKQMRQSCQQQKNTYEREM